MFYIVIVTVVFANTDYFLSAETRAILSIVRMMSLQLFLVSIVLLTCVYIGATQDDGESF